MSKTWDKVQAFKLAQPFNAGLIVGAAIGAILAALFWIAVLT